MITLILMMDGHLASIGTFAPRVFRSVTCVTHTICVKVAHAVMTSLLERYRCWGTDLPLGAACMSDDMCSSKVCRDGICVVVDQPLGSNCSKYNELCASNSCVEGI